MGWMASFKRHDEDQDDDAPPNPWVKLLDSFYPGRNPQEGEEIDSSSAFPAQERQGWKLETPIDHSITKAINAVGKHIIPILPMMYLSKNGRGESNAGEGNSGYNSKNDANTQRIVSYIDPRKLHPTEELRNGRNALNRLTANIKLNGMETPITCVEYEGRLYIVNGHHRHAAARKLNLDEVPVERVTLPYGDYKTPEDLFHYGRW